MSPEIFYGEKMKILYANENLIFGPNLGPQHFYPINKFLALAVCSEKVGPSGPMDQKGWSLNF